jgi:hypothetical protein
MDQISYANTIGALMHAMVCMRLDISHVVNMMSWYMHDSRKGH